MFEIIGLFARELSQILVRLAWHSAIVMELCHQADIQKGVDSFDFILGNGSIDRFEGCS